MRVTDTGMEILEEFIPAGRKNRPGRYNPCSYITIHETGNRAKTADAAAHATYLKSDAAAEGWVSWHYTVDDKSVWQHLPDGESAYHAGDGGNGPGNRTSIGIEICVNAGGDFEKAKKNAAALVRLLRGEHDIPLENVVQHNHWSGKNCPQTIRESGKWPVFKAMCVDDGASSWAKASWEKAVKKGIFDGTDPRGTLTREQAAVILDRLGLL
jgi:N-acetylmuramoyl-L-alanine amidase CwlA